EIPIGEGERMWTPKMEARVLQELDLKANEAALEIGTGSGYLTALLARSCGVVTSVDIHERFVLEARSKLARAGIGNVKLAVGDGARGWGSEQYEALVLTGSTPVLPDAWREQLRPGGRIFAVVGDAPAMSASRSGAAAEDLIQIYRDALGSDPVLASARATREATQELVPQARAGLLPAVNLVANAGVEDFNDRLHTDPTVTFHDRFP